MASAYDQNPGRWVCVLSAAHCNGKRSVHGKVEPCPLRGRCGMEPPNFYEYPLTKEKGSHYYRELVDPHRTRQHQERWEDVMQGLFPDLWKTRIARNRKRSKSVQEAKDRYEEKQRQEQLVRDWWDVHDEIPGQGGRGARHLLLPCGEDCYNCPNGGECLYTDEDEDELVHQEKLAAQRERQRKKREEAQHG